MKLKLTLVALAGLCFAQATHASITINSYIGALKTSTGANIAPNTTIILVSDTSGFSDMSTLAGELNGVTLATGSAIGSGGKILQVYTATDLGGGNFGLANSFTGDLTALGLTGSANTATATDLAILWFPGLTGTSGTLTSGQSFGYYRSDTVDAGSYGGAANVPSNAISFNVPADGFDYDLSVDTSASTGIPAGSLNATGTIGAVPEPSRLAFVFLGLMGLIVRRKRK